MQDRCIFVNVSICAYMHCHWFCFVYCMDLIEFDAIYIIVLYSFIWLVFFIQTCKRMYLIISKFWTTTFTLSSKRKSQLLYPTLSWNGKIVKTQRMKCGVWKILQEPQHRSTKADPILNARLTRVKLTRNPAVQSISTIPKNGGGLDGFLVFQFRKHLWDEHIDFPTSCFLWLKSCTRDGRL